MYTEARNDAKLRSLTDAQHRVWFNLLCMASEPDDHRGSIVDYDEELLAIEVANGDGVTLRDTLERLQKLRIITIANDTITFINFSARQYDKPSDQPDATAERKRRSRAKKVSGVTITNLPRKRKSRDVTPGHTTEKSREDTEESRKERIPPTPQGGSGGEPPAFTRFWLVWPKRKAKPDALRAWTKINPGPELVERIIAAVEANKQTTEWRKDGGQFIPYPATWLNRAGWEDELTIDIVPAVVTPIRSRSEQAVQSRIDDALRIIQGG